MGYHADEFMTPSMATAVPAHPYNCRCCGQIRLLRLPDVPAVAHPLNLWKEPLRCYFCDGAGGYNFNTTLAIRQLANEPLIPVSK